MEKLVSATYADIDVADRIREQFEKQKHLGRVFFSDFIPVLVDHDPLPGVRKFLIIKFEDDGSLSAVLGTSPLGFSLLK